MEIFMDKVEKVKKINQFRKLFLNQTFYLNIKK
jgi:hypothetical protein